MCGDCGLPHELFQCKVCQFRSQHRYPFIKIKKKKKTLLLFPEFYLFVKIKIYQSGDSQIELLA